MRLPKVLYYIGFNVPKISKFILKSYTDLDGSRGASEGTDRTEEMVMISGMNRL